MKLTQGATNVASVNSDSAPVLLISISLLDVDELVLDIRCVVGRVDGVDLCGGAFLNFGPAVDLEAEVVLDNVGVRVSESDSLSLVDNVELLVEGLELDAAVLITDEDLGDTVHCTTIISSTLAGDRYRANLQVHVDTSTRLELGHSYENRFAKGGFLLRG